MITLKSDQTVNYETTTVSAGENPQAVKKAVGSFATQLSKVNAFIYRWISFPVVTPCLLSLTVSHLASVNRHVNFKVIYYSM